MHLPVLALSGTLISGLPGLAQDHDPEAYILDLAPTVLDLSATVQEIGGEPQDMSAKVQETLSRSGDIEVRQSEDDFILSVASDVLFAFDSADLSLEAQNSLTDVAAVVSLAPEGQVLVVGHTDSKGPDVYNRTLSERRAQSVSAFLEQQGVASDRLHIEGRGESDPIAANEIDGQDNPDGRAKNRRVEFIVPKSMLQN